MGSPPCDGSLGVDKIVLFSGCFVVLGTDLAQRFSDQFLPLRVSLELSWARSDSTIIQMPLHSAEQAANFKFANSVECGDADIGSILDKFKAHASSSLLFMKAVEDVQLLITDHLLLSFVSSRQPSMMLLGGSFSTNFDAFGWQIFVQNRMLSDGSFSTNFDAFGWQIFCTKSDAQFLYKLQYYGVAVYVQNLMLLGGSFCTKSDAFGWWFLYKESSKL
jgi:hypothetical protein